MAETGIKKNSKLYICATPQSADLLQAGYEALTWVEISNVVTLPDFGVSDNIVTQDYINTTVSQKRKGFSNASDTEVMVGQLDGDAGQEALAAASLTAFNYALKLEQDDAPDAATTNTIRYSRGVIGGRNFTGGGGEDFDNETYAIGLNQAPIVVAPTAII